jgi:copper chaperone CopZ
MKIKKYIAIICIALVITSCKNEAETKTASTSKQQPEEGVTTATFKVWGNCEMCKETIEKSLKVDGIAKANWDTESKMVTVNYDSQKISLDQIQKNVSLAGYDNEKYKGDDKAYKELPECCQYERK